MNEILMKRIRYFGADCYLICDGNCNKAWGLVSRPRIQLEGREYWVSDAEFEHAPMNPQTYEGSDGKPVITCSMDMNKWCARACERSRIVPVEEFTDDIELPNWDERHEVEEL